MVALLGLLWKRLQVQAKEVSLNQQNLTSAHEIFLRYEKEEMRLVCKKKQIERKHCFERPCRNEPGLPSEDPRCQLTDWGDFSSCSAKCGKGTSTRSRRYRNRSAAKMCAAGKENPPPLENNMQCDGEDPGCTEDEVRTNSLVAE